MNQEQKADRTSIDWLIICGILIVLAVIVFPDLFRQFFPEHARSGGNACINNLRQIDAAASEFALEHSRTNGASIQFPDDLTPYIKLNSMGKVPPCPAGGKYSMDKVGDPPTCSLGTTVNPPHVLPR